MSVRSFDYCAFQFLNQWLEKEKGYCDSLASDNVDTQREALIAAGGHFRIARNLPTRFEEEKGLHRYQPVLDVLNKMNHISSDNVVNVVNEARLEISSHYGGRGVLSATTKFLWLKRKSPIRIYDRQARIALGTREGDFSEFNAAFSARYEECFNQIEKACANLSHVIPYLVNPNLSKQEVDDLVSEQWFRERVLDIYLWNQGNI